MPTKEVYQTNKEHYRQYNKQYLREWKAKHPEKVALYSSRVVNDPEYQKEYLTKPLPRLKYIARQQLNIALRKAEIIRKPCSVKDECRGRLEAHHNDYSQPLKVDWYCKKHHEQRHHS